MNFVLVCLIQPNETFLSNFNDVPEIVPTREITTETEKVK